MSNLMITTTPASPHLSRSARCGLLVLTLFPSLAAASEYWCAAGSHQPEPSMPVPHVINYMHPFNDVPLRNILGNMTIDMPILCGGGQPGDTFRVYRTTQMQAGMDNQTCQLKQPNGQPVQGIGVRLRSSRGSALQCNEPSPKPENLVFEMVAGSPTSSVAGFKIPVALEYIKTGPTTNLPPGLNVLEFPLTNSFVAINSQGRVQNDWGRPHLSATSGTLVSNCALAQISTPVRFGQLALDQLHTSERPFSVQLKNCGSAAAANLFNGAMSMTFHSGKLNYDGTLANDACTTCAKGIAIEVMKDDGTRVDLTRRYKMSDGSFSITGDTIEQRFKARLIPTGTTTGGEIRGLLTLVFTSR